MRIALFTRTGYHHTSFINRLQEAFEIDCIVREAYPESREHSYNNIDAEDSIYLKELHDTYSAGFTYHPILGDFLRAPFDDIIRKTGTQYLDIQFGEINSPDFAAFLRSIEPDIIAVLGSSVVKPDIIDIPSIGCINLHSGLSPYYRGTWSYGWPIVNDEPEYIGATVHCIDPGIDTGDVLFQTKPSLEGTDDLNSIFLKVITEGMELMVKALQVILDKGTAERHEQPVNTGRHYTMQDLDSESARRCLRNLENGIIDRYNAEKAKRDSRVALFGFTEPVYYT
jgi:hypothetical protein